MNVFRTLRTLSPPALLQRTPLFAREHARSLWVVGTLLIFLLVVLIPRTPTVEASFPQGKATLELADTPAARERGLSGRDDMPEGRGMLFVMDKYEIACFWMKDMRFNIDIVWLDKDRRVVWVARNVQVSSYPDSICPRTATKYVIELNSYDAARYGIKLGTRVDWR